MERGEGQMGNVEISRLADLHNDERFVSQRATKRDDREIAERIGQFRGEEAVGLIYRSVYDRFPEYMERYETGEVARHAYDQAIDCILDIRRRKTRRVVETKDELDTPGLKSILHIEGLNTVVTDGDLPRLAHLWDKGIRSLGSIYAHEDTIGGGNDADANIGLKPMGERIVVEAIRLGMAVDLAHYNRKTKDDILDLVGNHGEGCVAYTHGSLFDASKPNLRQRAIEEAQVVEILRHGGLIGLSVCKPFVNSVEELVQELVAVGDLSGFTGVSIGTDFGGVSNDELVDGMRCYRELYDTLGKQLTDSPGVNDDEIHKLFGENIFSFTHRMLPEGSK